MTLETSPRTRRSLLAALAAVGGAIVARAFGAPEPAQAVNGDNVQMGQTVTGSHPTQVINWSTDPDAIGFKGRTSATGSGPDTVGVVGESDAQNGTGVKGIAASSSGSFTTGVWGTAVNGRGVVGSASGTSGPTYGIYGRSYSTAGTGVYGRASAASGTNYGVYGQTDSTGGRGVAGHATAGGVGVYGSSLGNGSAVYGNAQDPGFGYGVTGLSAKSSGVLGSSLVSTGFAAGVYGSGNSPGGAGVYGSNTYAGTGVWAHTYGGWALYAEANYAAGQPEAYAGYFVGKTHVAGTFTASTKSFLIDHPQDPEKKTLAHSCVEAPEMLNVYRGNVTLDAQGRATVALPGYFEALNTSFSFQLTAIGSPAPNLHVAKKITKGSFDIGGGTAGQEVAWQVTGARADAWAKAHPLEVEKAKAPSDRGKYLNPEAFAKPKADAVHYRPAPDAKLPNASDFR